MITLSQILMATSAFVILLLGSIHLLYTFRSNKLYPRDTHLERQMNLVSPVLTRQTTMWNIPDHSPEQSSQVEAILNALLSSHALA